VSTSTPPGLGSSGDESSRRSLAGRALEAAGTFERPTPECRGPSVPTQFTARFCAGDVIGGRPISYCRNELFELPWAKGISLVIYGKWPSTMSLTQIAIDQITESDLRALIVAQTAETLRIDYKRATYGGNDEQRKEYLADVSSFANSAGGDLVIGMSAADGLPTGIVALTGDTDAERLRLESIARDGLEPRISNLRTALVPIEGGGSVIVVRIPKSYNPPHRVIFKGSGKFWLRTSGGKYEPNVGELRRIFSEAPLLAERIRAFRQDRIGTIAAGETPITLAGDCLMTLHIVPYSALDRSVPLSIAQLERNALAFPPLGRPRGTHNYVNFDGFVVLSNSNDDPVQKHHSYAQVFRNGIVEAVATIDRTDGSVMTSNIDKYAVANSKRIVDALAQFDVEPPFAVLVSLIGIRGRAMTSGVDGLLAPYADPILRQDMIHFAEVILESVPATLTETALAVSPLLEQVWNTAGFASLPTLTDGRWLFGV
jgi:hypothetical protein